MLNNSPRCRCSLKKFKSSKQKYVSKSLRLTPNFQKAMAKFVQ